MKGEVNMEMEVKVHIEVKVEVEVEVEVKPMRQGVEVLVCEAREAHMQGKKEESSSLSFLLW